MSIITKLLSHPRAKLIMAIIAIILLFIIYKIYAWANTQSTDNAYIEADISSVSAEVGGVIDAVFVKENNFVKAGQIIAKIKEDDYVAQLAKIAAMLEGAKHDIEMIEQNIKLAMIEQSKASESYEFAEENFKFSEIDYKRIEELSKDNFASKKNLDSTKIAFEKAKSELSQANFNMQTSSEELILLEIKRLAAIAKHSNVLQEHNLAQRALNNTNIKAPIAGMIGNSSLRAGNYVAPGVVLFSVVPIDELYVKANFKETQISKFLPGMKAKITIDSEPNSVIIGTIRNVSPATGAKFSLLPPSNATGNFTKIVQRVPVLIDFVAPEDIKHKIVPGMSSFIQVRLDQATPEELIVE
ncbi:MAG: HlyD family secretion protein [Rickettsiaceae bacterium]|nr:HlyD family secretion protein [Rickettsiaceae bacterium]MDP5021045.1 HlyD family secretion protein [Rickettsiaceae bacterium]